MGGVTLSQHGPPIDGHRDASMDLALPQHICRVDQVIERFTTPTITWSIVHAFMMLHLVQDRVAESTSGKKESNSTERHTKTEVCSYPYSIKRNIRQVGGYGEMWGAGRRMDKPRRH